MARKNTKSGAALSPARLLAKLENLLLAVPSRALTLATALPENIATVAELVTRELVLRGVEALQMRWIEVLSTATHLTKAEVKHLYKRCCDEEFMVAEVKAAMGLERHFYAGSEEHRASESVLDTREAHDPIGMPDAEVEKDDTKVVLGSPKLANFIGGVASGEKLEEWSPVSAERVAKGIDKAWRFVKDAVRPDLGTFEEASRFFKFGSSFWVGGPEDGHRYYTGTINSNRGEIHVFARKEGKSTVIALVDQWLVKIQAVPVSTGAAVPEWYWEAKRDGNEVKGSLGKGKFPWKFGTEYKVARFQPTLTVVAKVEAKVRNKYWGYYGRPLDLVPRPLGLTRAELVTALVRGGVAVDSPVLIALPTTKTPLVAPAKSPKRHMAKYLASKEAEFAQRWGCSSGLELVHTIPVRPYWHQKKQ